MTNDGFHSYTYDAEGRITKVDSGTTATYAYDAFGHRVLTTLGSTATGFVFNAAGQRVSLWNATTQSPIQGQYYWGSTPVAFHKSSAAHFQHQDWMGTERIRTEYNGTVEGTFTSLPFGDDLTTASGTDTDAYHYGMLDHDPETDTEHAQFRQYNSAQGRWMSPDPYSGSYDLSNPQSFNRYAYVMNSPIGFVDPLGLELVCRSTSFYVDGNYDSTETICFNTNDPGGGGGGGAGVGGGGGGAPNNGTPQAPQQPKKQPWYCGAGNSWSHPFTAPTGRQYGKWAMSDAGIAFVAAKYLGPDNPVTDVFTVSSIVEGYGWAACN